jgi:hypothetical protein
MEIFLPLDVPVFERLTQGAITSAFRCTSGQSGQMRTV